MKRLLTYLLLLPIYFYRNCISPFTHPSCRFTPTCSQYAIEALKKHGPFKGLWLDGQPEALERTVFLQRFNGIL